MLQRHEGGQGSRAQRHSILTMPVVDGGGGGDGEGGAWNDRRILPTQATPPPEAPSTFLVT